MLKIENLVKRLSGRTILNECSIEVPSGSVLGLIGPNGAGKSTLLRCISDVYKCDEGSITWKGETISENVYLKQNILLLSDDPFYLMNATIADMKEFYKTFYPQFDDEAYKRYLKIFGLDERKQMNNFSKGMKRQAFILMALAIGPTLLLLDESFDGLDPMMRLVFKRAISECIEKKDMTIIISSHNLRELEDICDSFAILDNNKITSAGDIDETKDSIHKYQLAFSYDFDQSIFTGLNVMQYKQTSRVVSMVIEGNSEEVEVVLKKLNPVMMESLTVSLEEIFLTEMEKKGGYDYE